MFSIVPGLLGRWKDEQNLHQTETDSLLTTRSNNPLDITPLSPILHDGLIAISVLATLSLLATFSLICFITYRFVFWQKYYKRSLSTNQYIVLIYNLLLADFLQALAFVLCIHWVRNDAIRAGTAACFLQGIFLQAGDPGSGLFVLTIAAHTFLLVHSGRMIDHRWFVIGVIGVWGFLAILIIIPLAPHGAEVFIPSGAWVSFLLVTISHICSKPDFFHFVLLYLTMNFWCFSAGSTTNMNPIVFTRITYGFSWPSSELLCYTQSCSSSFVDRWPPPRFSPLLRWRA